MSCPVAVTIAVTAREEVVLNYSCPAKYEKLRSKIDSVKITLDAADGTTFVPVPRHPRYVHTHSVFIKKYGVSWDIFLRG